MPNSATFNYTGGWQSLTVPKGVSNIQCEIFGAGSGDRKGSYVHGSIDVKGGDVLWVLVGQHGGAADGHSGGSGGFGGGGDGGTGISAPGGDGGGGGTFIRWGSKDGQIVAVAGGAGGNSGDGGLGGRGGGDAGTDDGEDGGLGNAGSGYVGVATGGTGLQAGNGGASPYPLMSGQDGVEGIGSRAGHGGSARNDQGPGGGGGGGGYHPGGGGAGGKHGDVPGGGGGGGASHVGYHFSGYSSRGSGNTGHGQVALTWQDPATQGDSRPNNPSLRRPARGARIKGSDVTIKAELTDSDSKTLRMRVEYSTHSDLRRPKVAYSDWVEYHPNSSKKKFANSNVASVTLSGLDRATHYYARIWAEDSQGNESLGYTTADWFTNYPPNPPTLLKPDDNTSVSTLDSTSFTWKVNDPDKQAQAEALFEYHRNVPGWVWKQRHIKNDSTEFVVDPRVFRPGRFYTWRVKTKDPNGLWSEWSDSRTFYVEGVSLPPKNLKPDKDRVVYGDQAVKLNWQFVNGQRGSNQGNYDGEYKADIRYRVIGGKIADWITWFGHPNMNSQHTFAPGVFVPGFHYEWQVRTYNLLGDHVTPGDWSDSATFHSINTPGQDTDPLPNFSKSYHGKLGDGVNRAYLVVKGGHHFLGELTPCSQIQYNRQRDGMSKCTVTLDIKANRRACALAADVRCWQHEVVIYRTTADGTSRVWEGPVTRVAYAQEHVTIEATDVLAWAYRRILKQGFNDSYPNITSVVQRAADILANAYARDDPHVLNHLTVFSYFNDAKESQVKPDWSTTAWEAMDELAQRHGLDYTVVGRRIILNETHRPIGRLPVMRDEWFTAAPVVTEYGMNLATQYGVTNGNGLHGEAHRPNKPYGPVEFLASAYGNKSNNRPGTMTSKQEAKLLESMDQQAQRGISSRYPTPLHVRLPNNTGIRSDAPLSFDYLVPGVWIPLQARHVCRTVTQWQKLSSVDVIQTAGDGEKITVTMIPAPNGGRDANTTSADELTTEEAATTYAEATSYVDIAGVVVPPTQQGGGGGGGGGGNGSSYLEAIALPAGSTGITAPHPAGADVWVRWVAPAGTAPGTSGDFNTIGSTYDTALTLLKAADPDEEPTLTQVAYQDDNAGPGGMQSEITWVYNPGEVYYLKVYSYDASQQTLVLNFPSAGTDTGAGTEGSSNNSEANALPLPAGSTTYTQPGDQPNTGVWFLWTAPSDITAGSSLTVDTIGSDYFLWLSIYTASDNTQLAHVEGTPTAQASATITVNPGDVLYFGVNGDSAAGTPDYGTLVINYSVAPAGGGGGGGGGGLDPMLVGVNSSNYDEFNTVVSNPDGSKSGGTNTGLSVRRSYDNTWKATFANCAASGDPARQCASIYSFTNTSYIETIAAGSFQSQLTTFFNSIPTTHRIWWIFCHEIDAKGYTNYTRWKQAWANIRRAYLASTCNKDLVKIGGLLTDWGFSHGNALNYFDNNHDFVGVDFYEYARPAGSPPSPKSGNLGTIHPPSYFIDPAKAIADELGVPLIVGEYGAHPFNSPTDVLSPTAVQSRPYRMKRAIAYAASHGVQAFCYFHAPYGEDGPWYVDSWPNWTTPTDRSHPDNDSVAAFRDVLALHVRYAE